VFAGSKRDFPGSKVGFGGFKIGFENTVFSFSFQSLVRPATVKQLFIFRQPISCAAYGSVQEPNGGKLLPA
jgi:hypothetical protein